MRVPASSTRLTYTASGAAATGALALAIWARLATARTHGDDEVDFKELLLRI